MTGGDGAAEEEPVRCVCGRALRDEESKRLRLGPVCRRRLTGPPAPRPRRIGTPTATPHPSTIPARPAQLELFWDDQDAEPEPARYITDVPTGALL
ncbi:DUF6011 domain-containing protein [Streptomyces prasinus]|uniref:DUF6011 domain-containing protein n=1 Tax=Streptomyces prasinus TaxID=67345 RepID=UPI00362BC3C9